MDALSSFGCCMLRYSQEKKIILDNECYHRLIYDVTQFYPVNLEINFILNELYFSANKFYFTTNKFYLSYQWISE